MEQYINKDALVTKIDNLKHRIDDRYSYSNGWKDALRMLEAELDTLEVKEVNLEEEIDIYFDNYEIASKEDCYLTHEQACTFAKHFFELGLKAQKGE